MYKSVSYLLTAFMYCVAGQTISLDEYAIVINCQEPGENPATQLKLGLSLADNLAHLVYKDQTMTKPVTVAIYPPSRIYSSSSVTIKSVSPGNLTDSKKNILEISANMSATYRVIHYENFSLTMTKACDGQFVPNLLSYQMGIDAFPDSRLENTVKLSGLSCTVKGL